MYTQTHPILYYHKYYSYLAPPLDFELFKYTVSALKFHTVS